MFEKRVYLERYGDSLRRRMLREPRGFPGLCCNVILPPTQPQADARLCHHGTGRVPPMSGSNTICVVTVLLKQDDPDHGADNGADLESLAGLIRVWADVRTAR